jgi:hypothetical protein
MTTNDKKPPKTKTAKSVKTPKTPKTVVGAPETSAGARNTEKFPAASGPAVAGGGSAVAGGPPALGAAASGASPAIKAINVSVTPRYREDRQASIAKAAYFRSESRGFASGHEVEDWLAAEEEVDQRLLGEGRVS